MSPNTTNSPSSDKVSTSKFSADSHLEIERSLLLNFALLPRSSRCGPGYIK